MTQQPYKGYWTVLSATLLLLFVATCLTVLFAVFNLDKLGSTLSWITRSGYYVADYEDFWLSATSDEFFEFSSGYGRNSLAKVRIQMPDGNSYALARLAPGDIDEFFTDKSDIENLDTKVKIIIYSSGFNSVGFIDDQLESIHLVTDSGVAIDFGDGQFVSLPVARAKLHKLLGPPKKWSWRNRGLP